METQSSEPYESFIERTTPEVPIYYTYEGKKQLAMLRYNNCLIVIHPDEYREFDHVHIYDDIPYKFINLFRFEGDFEIGKGLMDLDFAYIWRPFPSIEDEEEWFKHQVADVEDF